MTIVIAKASGGVAVMRLVNGGDAATCLDQWKAANPGEYVTHAEVAEEALPQDRSERALWSLVDGVVVVDPALAPVPQVVSRRQARRALLDAGLLASVQPAIDAVQDATLRAQMQIDWDDSQEFQRDHPTLLALGSALGLDAAGIDALFIAAAAL
jgi:hypothetical protein